MGSDWLILSAGAVNMAAVQAIEPDAENGRMGMRFTDRTMLYAHGDDAVIVAWWLSEHASRHPHLSLDLGALKLREDGDG